MKAERVASAPGRASKQPDGDCAFLPPDEIVVGKDVLELLSSAMYLDPMTIYREYVQNAADAIDEARCQGLLGTDEAGEVEVDINPAARRVLIRDNGTGIAWPTFINRLTSLGASSKRGTTARGFRGVGRLAGLAYAQELIFRSRVAGEKFVSELRWDCRKLKSILLANGSDSGIVDLIRSVVVAGRIDPGDRPDRFFEVELRGVVRQRSDKLMSADAVAEYLGQVAPVPFSPKFRFGTEIAAMLRSSVDLGELEIQVSGVAEPVYRPHRDVVVVDDKSLVKFEEVEFIEVPGVDGTVAGIGWILHHDYEGAIPTSALIKGLRLRSGNIQVGDHTLLEELFPEPRFNVWAVGEVHVVEKRIVANGRRDHFEQNVHLHNLVNHLTPTARDIARRCRTSSIRRKWLREFEMQCQSVEEKLGIMAQGSLGAIQRDAMALTAEQDLRQMEKVAGMDILLLDDPDDLKATVVTLQSKLSDVRHGKALESSPLAHLTFEKRTMYEHLFGLIYECSTNRIAAKSLIDRILPKLG